MISGWNTYTVKDGLLSNQVYSAAMDKFGRLWFGCKNPDGLTCFDGDKWTNYTQENSPLPGGHIWDMKADNSGGIWAGTAGGGLIHFDGENLSVLTMNDGLSGNHVYSLAFDPGGRLWCGCAPPPDQIMLQGGVSVVDGDVITNYQSDHTQGKYVGGGNSGLCDNRVYAITFDRKGNAWFGTKGGGISRYDGQMWQTFNRSNGFPVDEVGDGAAAPFGDDGVWIGLRGGGVGLYTEGIWKFYDRSNGLAGDFVYAIIQDVDDNWWIGCSPNPEFDGSGGGISHYDGKNFVNITSSSTGGLNVGGGNSPLADNKVYAIVFDIEGNGWFGTKGGGISRLDKAAIAAKKWYN